MNGESYTSRTNFKRIADIGTFLRLNWQVILGILFLRRGRLALFTTNLFTAGVRKNLNGRQRQ